MRIRERCELAEELRARYRGAGQVEMEVGLPRVACHLCQADCANRELGL
jgi:hypothetical protein